MSTGKPADDATAYSQARAEAADHHAMLQQQWHGWGSPVGIGLGLLCLGAGIGALLMGVAAISAVGALLS